MYIKKRNFVFLTVLPISIMIIEWRFVSFRTEERVTRKFHGVCNVGVGDPYSDFMHQLRTIFESGDTNTLARALQRGDQHSRDIFEVWLAEKPNAYRSSIREILR